MVVSIVITIFGVVSAISLPISQYPEITPAEIKVEATYTGANAIAVEQSVATPLEQKVNGVENMIYMKSVNSGDGKMSLTVSFDVGSDLDNSNVLVQNRVSEGQASLPEEVKRLGVTVKKSLTFPLMLVTLRSPNGTFDNNFLTNYGKINIVDELSRIHGVGQVNMFGGSEYAMRIWVKPDRLSQLGLTVPDITRAVQEQNVIAPAGKIGAPPAPPGTEFTYAVQTKGRLATEKQFEEVIIRSNPDGSQIFLKDIARVELGSEIYNSIGRLDGAPAAILAIYQLPGSNGLQVATEIRETMKSLSKNFPSDLEHFISLDTTKAIEAGISEIVSTLFQAVLLVILVVYLFLQNFRATLIPLIAIPVSLIGAFIVFPILGFSINTLSLLGLVLAIGTVVDDAIVVVESVSLNIEDGLSPKEATLKTMREVSGPIVATSLALIAVFVPVAFMGGITGRLYQQFAITIAVSVIFSSVNALTLSPALAALLLKPASDKTSDTFLSRFFQRFNDILEKTTGRYVTISKFFVTNIRRSVIFLLLIVLAVIFLGSRIPAGFVPEEDQGYMLANITLPDAASLQRTDEVTSQVEKILAATDGIDSYTSVAGFSLLSGAMQTNNAFLFISLKPWAERGAENTAANITRRLNQIFAKKIPQAVVVAFGPPAIPGLGTGSGFSIMLQDKAGNTPEYLEAQSQKFIQAANARPEIARAFTTYRASVPQIFADIDRAKVLKQGAKMSDVNTALGSFLGGSYINDFNRFGRLYRVYVQAEPEYRTSTNDLGVFFVRGDSGQMVPLSTLIKTKRISGPEFTNRFNLFRAAEITGAPAPGYSSAQALTALEEVAKETLPEDMTYAWNAMSYQEMASAGSLSTTFLFAMLFVFLILAAQYESWSLPLSVLLGTPFAVLGAFSGLWISRFFSESYVNNVFAQIGLVLLIGLAAKNAILIVEFARVKRDEGFDATSAALEAAKMRFRPILMTAFSFILGVLPLLVATGAGAEARKVMGMAVFAGMLMATLLGVCLVPVLFVIVDTLFSKESDSSNTSPAGDSKTAGSHAA